MKNFEQYNRKAIFSKVKEFCHLSKEEDFIEVCEWANGEGFDICTGENETFQLTHGEWKLLKKLVKKIEM